MTRRLQTPALLRDRRNHYDVTDRVCIAEPADVLAAVQSILHDQFPDADSAVLLHAFNTFTRLYAGSLPGYVGCDTWYHDAQHGLDCALAMARILDGHERSVPLQRRLGTRRAVLGIVIALFHDAGYIRRDDDSARNGAEFTLTHVERSAEFLRSYLPQVGYGDEADLAARIVHFTGFEIALERIDVSDPHDRTLGFLLGTADVLAQTADRCYLEKCRDYLFREFEVCGIAGEGGKSGTPVLYRSPEDLLKQTPDFNRKLWEERLDGYFGGAYRYIAAHFGGCNPYVDSIRCNLERVRRMISRCSFSDLKLRPQVVGAREMREQIADVPMYRTSAPHPLPSSAHKPRRQSLMRRLRNANWAYPLP